MLSVSAAEELWLRVPRSDFIDELFDMDLDNRNDTDFEVLNVPSIDFYASYFQKKDPVPPPNYNALQDKKKDPMLTDAMLDHESWGIPTFDTSLPNRQNPLHSPTLMMHNIPAKPFVPKNHTPNQRSLLISSIKRQQQQQMKYIRHDHSFSKQPIAVDEAKARFETPEGSSEDDNSMDEVPSQYQQVLDFITTDTQQALQLLRDMAQEECDTDLSDYLQGNFEVAETKPTLVDIKKEIEEEDEDDDSSSSESGSSSGSSGSESSESEDSEADDVPMVQVTHQPKPIMYQPKTMFQPKSMFQDHAYHKPLEEADTTFVHGRNKTTRLENMGVETPSDTGSDSSPNIDLMRDYDSRRQQNVYVNRRPPNNPRIEATTRLCHDDIDEEEEIDVVNIGGDSNSRVHFKIPMPTNPSPLDRKSIQNTVATAIRRRQRQFPIKSSPYARNTNTTNNTIEHQQISPPLTPTGRIRKKRGPANPGNNLTIAANPTENVTPPPTTTTTKGRRKNNRQRRKRGNGESDSDSDENEKRNQHNNMERQRRVDLRHLFDDLRKSVPSLRTKDRAAKVAILKGSRELVLMLMAEDREYQKQKLRLKKHQDMLMGRVSSLRRILASNR